MSACAAIVAVDALGFFAEPSRNDAVPLFSTAERLALLGVINAARSAWFARSTSSADGSALLGRPTAPRQERARGRLDCAAGLGAPLAFPRISVAGLSTAIAAPGRSTGAVSSTPGEELRSCSVKGDVI